MKKRCWKGYAPVKGKKPYSKGSCRKVRRNPSCGVVMNPARQPDAQMASELILFFQNDEFLLARRYPQFILNLERKMKRGVYDREKAVKLFMYLADEISKKYSKDFGDGKTHAVDVPTRMLLAKMLRDRFESERRAMGIPVGAMPRMNPSSSAARLRRQAEIMEMDERLVPSTMTYEDIKDDPKLIAHYKKIMTPMAWKQLVDDWIRSGVRSGSGRRDFVIPKESEYRRMVSENPSGRADSVRRREVMAASVLITAIESGYGWFYTKNYKIAELGDLVSDSFDKDTPYKVSADIILDEEVTKDDYPDEFSKDYQPKRTFKAGEKIHVDNETIRRGLQLVSSGKIKVADSYRKLATKLNFWPYDKNSQGYYDMPDFDAYDADIFLQAGVFGNVIFG